MKERTLSLSLVAALIVTSLLAVYLYLNTKGTFQFKERRVLRYDLLAEAFLDGQLHLKIPPNPDRARAADPTDPELPYPFIVDAIIWDGRHYFTQDPAPAILHALYIAFLGVPCHTGFMIIVFAAGSLMGLWLILRVVQQSFAPDQEWTLWLTWLCFALSGAQLYMVSRPVVYHEAIAAGMFFTLMGTYCFVRQTLGRKGVAWLVLASSLWGLGVASRISLIFYPVVFILCGLYLAVRDGDSRARLAGSAVALTAPVALSVFVLLLYNYYRFGDFLDFGRTHITVPDKHLHVYLTLMDNSFRLAHLPFNLYHYFLSLPEFSLRVPFLIHPNINIIYMPHAVMARENVSSFLFTMPVVLFAIPSLTVIRSLRGRPLLAAVLAAFVVGSAATFVLLLCYYRAVSRYLFEFTPLLLPLILCNVAALWNKTEGYPAMRRTLIIGIAGVFVLNMLTAVCLGLNGMIRP